MTRSLALKFRVCGRERRIKIGSHPDWSVQATRDEDERLKRAVDAGEDPMAVRHAERAAPPWRKPPRGSHAFGAKVQYVAHQMSRVPGRHEVLH